MCPENPVGYCELAGAYVNDYSFGNTKNPQETLEKAEEMAKKAVAIDDLLPVAHVALGNVYIAKRDYEKAIAEGQCAVSVDPGNSTGYQIWAGALTLACRPIEALPLYHKLFRVNPNATSLAFMVFGHALRMAGRFEEAVSAFKKSIERAPNNNSSHIGLAATYIAMGREEEARAEAQEILKINPHFSLADMKKRSGFTDPSEKDKMADALRKAGLK